MARHWIVKSPRGAWRYGAALGLVALSTATAEIIYRVFDTDRLSMVFLAAVLIAAVARSLGPCGASVLDAKRRAVPRNLWWKRVSPVTSG